MKQTSLFTTDNENLVNLKEASIWASQYLKRKVSTSNLTYLIQYGKINKYENNGMIMLNIKDLKEYYDTNLGKVKKNQKFGGEVNWHLSFLEYSEAERTKHVHRLHPYKGKFIPQLVEYFLDSHTDEFKKDVYFHKGDIVLDPFCGSGTTLVQANELNLHAIGIDISFFNTLISNVKIRKHNLIILKKYIDMLNSKLKKMQENNNINFENDLLNELAKFNNKNFPSPEYKKQILNGKLNEDKYSKEKEKEFLTIFDELVKKYRIKIKQDKNESFLDKWFIEPVRKEIDFLADEIKLIKEKDIKDVLTLILSRTVRSCRATTHADLATLKDPVFTTYYCKKHGKICKPIFSIKKWWEYYTKDTIKRFYEFEKVRTNTFQICLTGDSRTIDIYEKIKETNPEFAKILLKQKIKGIFSSPPYVGLIDYHEQHAYSYEIFGFKRADELEIGALFKGQDNKAKTDYIKGIADVLKNCKKYLQDDYDIFLVANDKFNLYSKIAELAEMKIVNSFQRPVLNRVEKNRDIPYTETIFHLKEK